MLYNISMSVHENEDIYLLLTFSCMLTVSDPRTRDWFLLNRTPVYVWALTILYLLFVWLGPKYMRNRPAYNLQAIMIIYNFGLVALSIYMFVEV